MNNKKLQLSVMYLVMWNLERFFFSLLGENNLFLLLELAEKLTALVALASYFNGRLVFDFLRTDCPFFVLTTLHKIQ